MEVFLISVNYKFGWKFLKRSSKNTHNESVRVSLFDLKQVESVTKLVKLKVSLRSDKWLDEVGIEVFIFKSHAQSKLSYLFKALLSVTETAGNPGV